MLRELPPSAQSSHLRLCISSHVRRRLGRIRLDYRRFDCNGAFCPMGIPSALRPAASALLKIFAPRKLDRRTLGLLRGHEFARPLKNVRVAWQRARHPAHCSPLRRLFRNAGVDILGCAYVEARIGRIDGRSLALLDVLQRQHGLVPHLERTLSYLAER